MTETHEHIVPEQTGQERLDRYAFSVFPGLVSRKAARRLAREGNLLLNGEPANASRWIHPGDVIVVHIKPRAPRKVFELPIEVVYEDDCMAIVNKPPGYHVNGPRPKTIEQALPFNLQPTTRSFALAWARPVHRLDARTGGLLVIAKTMAAATHLGHQFQNHSVLKRYRALLVGRLEGEGEVIRPVQKRHAQTTYKVIAHCRSLHCQWITTVDMWPLTGRNHQLRRHMTSLGHAVLGDDLHNNGETVLRSQGLFLRALELSLCHPDDERALHFVIDEPEKFSRYRARETRRWERYFSEDE
jgi:23S rRNA pseudouridine1911/1915/1917 synthase